MRTVRDIIKVAVQHCTKSIEQDAFYVDNLVKNILNLPEILPYKNRVLEHADKPRLSKLKTCRPMSPSELKIAVIVSEHSRIDINDLFGRARHRTIVEVRGQFISFLYFYKCYTYTNLGSMFGRDHSTIIHNVATHQNLIDTSRVYASKFYILVNKIKAEVPDQFIDVDFVKTQQQEYNLIKIERKAKKYAAKEKN